MCQACELPQLIDRCYQLGQSRQPGVPCFLGIGKCAESLYYIAWTCDGHGHPSAEPFQGATNPMHNLAILPFDEDRRVARVRIQTSALNKRIRNNQGLSTWVHVSLIQTGQYYEFPAELVHTPIMRAGGVKPGLLETLESNPGPAAVVVST